MKINMIRIPKTPDDAYNYVVKLAKKMKLSLDNLCKLAGITPSTVYRWKGKTDDERNYDITVFLRIVEAYRKWKLENGKK